MTNKIKKIATLTITSIFLSLMALGTVSAGSSTTYTKIGGNTWSNNYSTGETCVYSKVGNMTYRNCY